MEKSSLNLNFSEKLTGILIHPDGSHVDIGDLAKYEFRMSKWRRLYEQLKQGKQLPVLMGFGAFLACALRHDPLMPWVMGMVTSAGLNYMAADFLAASTDHIQTLRYMDSGTGTAINDPSMTALESPTGMARVAGTQSNLPPDPWNAYYQVEGTINYSGDYAITEWGIFSAAAAGTMWSRLRLAPPLAVSAGSHIAFTYILSLTFTEFG
jgi:hypothetical protein